MGNRIDNLGDYNIVRKELKRHNGDAASLFKEIGDAAVAEARPEILREGIKIGAISGGSTVGIVALTWLGVHKLREYLKQRKEDKRLIEEKEELKQQYNQVISIVEDDTKS